ncbi:RWD domain-containing protein, putative [Eimeria acervulina]|uniref:RWD domain-containing protein, putative n=1 Tax=Eimeria acervulina TaxID=5801 RepID=U6GLT4_EIMAC|nr:RWD domain-containing protein, putative [Eimeria acervulina]CDI80512.1 RWD domain-containing protein, putative [Eimeria acervulina]
MLNRQQQQQQPAAAAAAAEAAAAAADEDEDSLEQQIDASARGPAERTLCPASERCTREEFCRWAAAFAAEMQAKGIWASSNKSDVITGKQIFTESAAAAAAAAAAADNEPDGSAFWENVELFEDDANALPEDD